jgi:hypothetical protein
MEKIKKSKQPEFFSHTLSVCLRTFNWMFSFYVIFSTIFSLFYFYLGKDIITSKVADIDRYIIDNIYYAAVIILLLLLSYFSSEKKSIRLFSTYIIAINLLCLNYFFEFVKMTPSNHIHRVINWMIIVLNVLLISYIISMKINFNSFLINSKLYKIFPNMLFKKNDYYFMNTENNSEQYDRVDELKSSTHRKNNNQNNSEAFYSGSTIDAEYEPLK